VWRPREDGNSAAFSSSLITRRGPSLPARLTFSLTPVGRPATGPFYRFYSPPVTRFLFAFSFFFFFFVFFFVCFFFFFFFFFILFFFSSRFFSLAPRRSVARYPLPTSDLVPARPRALRERKPRARSLASPLTLVGVALSGGGL